MRETQRDTERHRETERDRETETDSQTDRQTDGQMDRQAGRQADIQTDRQSDRCSRWQYLWGVHLAKYGVKCRVVPSVGWTIKDSPRLETAHATFERRLVSEL